MNESVKQCIKRIYENKDYPYFKEKSEKTPIYLQRILEEAESICKEIEICALKNDPVIEIWFYFESYHYNDFCVDYKTLLKISKVADLFVFQHEFCVENKDPVRMTPILDGFGSEAYIILQNHLEETITHLLEKENLQKLQLFEMDEVITEIKIPQESIFGNQITVENALFRDLFGICED